MSVNDFRWAWPVALSLARNALLAGLSGDAQGIQPLGQSSTMVSAGTMIPML
eukprot:CAMPEP_0180782434 /NCGR_PEP_ID=MMETSP1038_2-20121128/48348_1 /TAXON_ID=632150 /ORGANISM="Azadinium spinosum, Strain 3D9" /LENGTH=51 /DNA_ID=CAMNT_0022818655 /DNA_START=19 /DNA_END=171 /DNA_ORIENTATION=-